MANMLSVEREPLFKVVPRSEAVMRNLMQLFILSGIEIWSSVRAENLLGNRGR